jgi:hypothetical protein
MGNETQGIVLTDQVQGVREASPPDGITIATDGTIHFDAASSTGTMKLNNPSAYNSYVWPTAKGTAGQQLETDASGNLFWADADGIDWTQKGQLLVGTGVGTGNETLLNPGPDNRVLKTSSGTASGLEWSELYVDVVPNITGAAVIPKGNTAQRPAAPLPGYLRMNQDFNTPDRLEVWDGDGPQWRQLAYVEDLPVLPPYAATVNTTLTGALYCSDFNISPGVTVTVEGGLFVFCSGDVTISGTLTASENGPSGARQFQGSFGPNTQITVGIGQGLGGGARNEGGFIYNVAVCPTGSGGGNGIISNTNAITMNGGAPGGGDGGGSIIIRSMRDINVTGGIVVSNGADGSISGNPNNIRFAGGGGGSGGTIILDASRNLTLNGAQILANGGVGGAGSNGGGAGGGGGGGYIITQVRYGVLNIIGATVRQANGGAGGPATVAATGTGAPGGGNAGKGGRAQNNAFGPGSHAGGIGSVSNFGSIYSLPNT